MVCNDVLRAMANDWIKRSKDIANTTESQASTLVGCAEELLELVEQARQKENLRKEDSLTEWQRQESLRKVWRIL